jgi:predicted ester cyclase
LLHRSTSTVIVWSRALNIRLISQPRARAIAVPTWRFLMPIDQRDAWIRAYLEDVFNGHNLQSLDKYMTENIVSHWLGDRSLNGREAWREAMAKFFDAFPDAGYTLNDVFCTGDKGVWRGTWNATQRKEWEGIPETGRKAKWTVIIIGRFKGEKLAEDWVEYDRYNLFRQLEPH